MAVNLQHGRPLQDGDLDIDVTYLEDQINKVRINEQITWIDKQRHIWTVPRGYVTDGASIPRWAWSIIGHPFYGRTLAEAALHDFYCDNRTRPHKEVHRMFLDVMLHCGVPKVRARIMYLAVRIGGPKWKSKRK